MKDLSKHYEQLTADERFRLWTEAMGRKDDQELDRLEATCPRRRYDAQDYEYTRRKQRFCQLAFMTAIRHLENDLLTMLAIAAELHPRPATTNERRLRIS